MDGLPKRWHRLSTRLVAARLSHVLDPPELKINTSTRLIGVRWEGKQPYLDVRCSMTWYILRYMCTLEASNRISLIIQSVNHICFAAWIIFDKASWSSGIKINKDVILNTVQYWNRSHTHTLAKPQSFSMHDFQHAGTHQSRHAWNKTNESRCNLCLRPVLSPPTPPNPVAIDTWMRFRSWRFPTILVTSTPSGVWFDKFYRHIHHCKHCVIEEHQWTTWAKRASYSLDVFFKSRKHIACSLCLYL